MYISLFSSSKIVKFGDFFGIFENSKLPTLHKTTFFPALSEHIFSRKFNSGYSRYFPYDLTTLSSPIFYYLVDSLNDGREGGSLDNDGHF